MESGRNHQMSKTQINWGGGKGPSDAAMHTPSALGINNPKKLRDTVFINSPAESNTSLNKSFLPSHLKTDPSLATYTN